MTAPPRSEFRYQVAHDLPDEVRAALSELRRAEREGGDLARAVTNEYLQRLHRAGWVLRALANAFDSVTVEAVRDRLEKHRASMNPLDAAARERLIEAGEQEFAETADVAADAWRLWSSTTSRPAARRRPVKEFVTEYLELIDAGYEPDDLNYTLRGAALIRPRARDIHDVKRATQAISYTGYEAAARELLERGDQPVYPYPAVGNATTRRTVDADRLEARLAELPLPEPPRPEPSAPAEPGRARYVIPAEVAEEMRELQLLAKNVKGSTAADHPNRAASVRLVLLQARERRFGATYEQIGQACDVSWNAVRMRLGRHGFESLPPSQADTFVRDLRPELEAMIASNGHPGHAPR